MFTFEDHMAQGQQAIKEVLTVCTMYYMTQNVLWVPGQFADSRLKDNVQNYSPVVPRSSVYAYHVERCD